MDLLLIVLLLLILWGGGFALQIGGSLIHALLILALIVFLLRITQNPLR